MSRFFFFTQEAFRALRRNGAPSMAAIVTTVTTVILLGVLVPVFQTTQAKSERCATASSSGWPSTTTRRRAKSLPCEDKLEGDPARRLGHLHQQGQALAELEKDLGKSKSEDLLAQLHDNPLPANFKIKADDASNLDAVRAAVTPPGPNGKPQPISPIIQDVFDRQQESQQIEQVTSALKIVLTVITALLDPRLADAGRQHDPALDLHPPPRGRGDAAGRRDPLVHPLALHDRGRRRRLRGGLIAILILWLGKITIVDPLSDTFSFLAAQNNSTLSFPALVAILFGAAVLVSAVGSGVTLRRFLKV